jgi:ArsR family transcriptional regulator
MGGPRLRILELLNERELCVAEIVAAANDEFSTVPPTAAHFARRRIGKPPSSGDHLYYTLADRHVADLIRNALAHASELEDGPA